MDSRINKQQLISLAIGTFVLLFLVTWASYAYLSVPTGNKTSVSTINGVFDDVSLGTITLSGGGVDLYLGLSLDDMAISKEGTIYYSSNTIGNRETELNNVGKATYTATLTGDDSSLLVYACDYEFKVDINDTILNNETLKDIEMVFEGDINKTISLADDNTVSGTWYGIRRQKNTREFNAYLKIENKVGNQSELAGANLSLDITNTKWKCYLKETDANGAIYAFTNGISDVTLDKSNGSYLEGLKLYGNSIQNGTPSPENPVDIESVGEKTNNLLNTLNRTVGTLSGASPSTQRNFEFNKFYVGLAVSGYYVNGNINSYSLENDIWTINVKGAAYGIGFPMRCEPNTTYTLSKDIGGTIGIAFYSNDGYYLSNIDSINSGATFTTPNDSYIAVIILRPAVNIDTQYSGLQVTLGSNVSDYEPYGYKIPIITKGKNKYSAKNGIYAKRIVSLDAIKVKPNTDYIISVDNYTIQEPLFSIKYLSEYVENLTPEEAWATGTQFKSNTNVFNSGDHEYIMIRAWKTNEEYGIDENTKIQLEEGNTSTAYEPYIESVTTNIYLDEPLRKIGDYADYIDFENSKVVRKIGYSNLKGKYKWFEEPGTTGDKFYYITNILPKPLISGKYNMCNALPVNYYIGTTSTDIGIEAYTSRIVRARPDLTVYSTVEKWQEYVNNNDTYLYYVIATEHKPIELPYIPTIEGTTYIEIDTDIQPSNMEVTYLKN